MSDFAAIAKNNWKHLTPSRYQELENPEEFFESLAEQAEDQAGQLELSLAGPDSPNEDFMAKWGRMNAARQQAHEIVIQELLTPPREQWETDEEDESEKPDPFWQSVRERTAQLIREEGLDDPEY